MKVRVKFSKQGTLRFVGHLDLMRYFQKAVRRSGIPIRYSEGYSPHQIMSFAAPLGIGQEGLGEYFDIQIHVPGETEESTNPNAVHAPDPEKEPESWPLTTSADAVQKLNAEMAEGITILSFLKIPDNAKNAMSIVHAADYRILFLPAPDADEKALLAHAAEKLLSAESIRVMKPNKDKADTETEIRPMIFSLQVTEEGFFARIAQGSEANLKPDLLMKAVENTEEGAFLKTRKRKLIRTEIYDAEMRALEDYGEPIL